MELIIDIDYGFVINLCIFSKGTQPFDFIRPSTVQKLAYKVKHISQVNGGLIMYFGNSMRFL